MRSSSPGKLPEAHLDKYRSCCAPLKNFRFWFANSFRQNKLQIKVLNQFLHMLFSCRIHLFILISTIFTNYFCPLLLNIKFFLIDQFKDHKNRSQELWSWLSDENRAAIKSRLFLNTICRQNHRLGAVQRVWGCCECQRINAFEAAWIFSCLQRLGTAPFVAVEVHSPSSSSSYAGFLVLGRFLENLAAQQFIPPPSFFTFLYFYLFLIEHLNWQCKKI